jgi:hypothetical protein
MADPKPKEIPEWQKKETAPETAESESKSPEREDQPPSTESQDTSSNDPSITIPRNVLIDSAKDFLQHEDIRDTPVERKAAFLRSKGLTQSEIDHLLEPSSSESSTPMNTSTVPSTPPIITYPEFLAKAHQPAPLMTRTRILNAVYATGMISAAIWGTNKYLLEPMFETLTAARHSLFDDAQSNLEQLNKKLEDVVSVVPPQLKAVDNDAESEASDPAELFHRDIGVQTSSQDLETSKEDVNPVETQSDILDEIHTQLQDLKTTESESLQAERKAWSSIMNLQAYLDEITYGGRKSVFQWEGPGIGDSRMGQDSKMDEIAKFKAEIRSAKGALLSARNFPSANRRP